MSPLFPIMAAGHPKEDGFKRFSRGFKIYATRHATVWFKRRTNWHDIEAPSAEFADVKI
jgi:hypothetical protein